MGLDNQESGYYDTPNGIVCMSPAIATGSIPEDWKQTTAEVYEEAVKESFVASAPELDNIEELYDNYRKKLEARAKREND